MLPIICLILILLCPSPGSTSSIHGIFASGTEQEHLARFCFRGGAVIRYKLNASAPGKLYLYSDEQWANLPSITHCIEKLKHSLYQIDFKDLNGEQALEPSLKRPQYLHVVFSDPKICGLSGSNNGSTSGPEFASFLMELVNLDSQGHPFNHFSYDDSGLLTFYEIVVLAYIIAACTYGHRLWQTVSKGGPMHLAIKMLSIAMVFHAAASLLTLIHLFCYSRDGVGAPVLSFFSKVLHGLCHYQVLVMMVSLAVGLTLSSSTAFDPKEEKLINNLVIGVSVIQGGFMIWEIPTFLVLVRIFICALLANSVRKTISKERSALRRDFYSKLIRDCYIWWLSYPAMVIFSVVFAEYLRKTLIIFGTTIGQGVAVFLMYKLFLSRSLYWEVSALSSTTLPLRLDKTFGMRKYTS